MTVISRTGTNDTQTTSQTMENRSFDREFNVNAVEILGHESSGNTLNRISVDTDGKLNVNATASLAKDTLPVSGATEAVGVAIVDGSGDQITSFGGGVQYTEGDTDATITGTALMYETNTGTNALGVVNATNKLPVDVGTVPVTGTFWQATQPVSFTGSGDVATQTTLAAINTKLVSGTDIGDVTVNNASLAVTQSGTWDEVGINDSGNSITVDNATISVVGGGAEATAQRVTIANDSTGVVSVDDNGGALTVDGTVTANVAAGTNAIGKLLAPDIDITTHTNYIKKYYTNAGAVTDGIIWSPAAGKRWHVTTLYIQTSAAATITLEDDKAAGDDPVWKGELAANSGVVIPFGEKYPLASGEDAADLLITTSAGNVYVTAVGYEI